MPKGHFDVAVVGLGPVGSVAALLLAREGLRIIAVDAALEPYDKPRAIGLDHETLRTLQAIGIADDLSPHLGAYRPSEYRSASGELLRRIVPSPEPHALGWPPYCTFVQPQLEELLRSKLKETNGVSLVLGATCTAIENHDDHVMLSLNQDGRIEPVTADFVVACDGASSFIRESLNLPLEDLQFDEPWLVVDVLAADSAVLPETIVQYCDPARPCTFIPGPGQLRRWEIMLLGDEDPVEMLDEANVWALLSRWITPDQGRIWRKAAYRFHALVARQWSKGRVFIAGDAAHQTPPFMAQGLNQGVRDVANLSWKIGQVMRHGADIAMLESYELERRPNCRAVIELTKALGRLICEKEPAAAATRDRQLLAEVRSGQGEVVRQSLLPDLDDGLLSRRSSGDLSPGAGQNFPQSWIKADGAWRRMDDIVEGRFLLVALHANDIPRELQDDLPALGITPVTTDVASGDRLVWVDERDNLISAWMAKLGVTVALLRPDHVVFGTATTPETAAELVADLNAQLRLSNPGSIPLRKLSSA